MGVPTVRNRFRVIFGMRPCIVMGQVIRGRPARGGRKVGAGWGVEKGACLSGRVGRRRLDSEVKGRRSRKRDRTYV